MTTEPWEQALSRCFHSSKYNQLRYDIWLSTELFPSTSPEIHTNCSIHIYRFQVWSRPQVGFTLVLMPVITRAASAPTMPFCAARIHCSCTAYRTMAHQLKKYKNERYAHPITASSHIHQTYLTNGVGT